ncbi:MAG TPA: argininosuccinate lyase [Candidatus Babeliales bacterium]|nr:argininosuccinate lyase [Candidatus Babeliales bacterium]
MIRTLQWGGRFQNAADKELLAFGSSLEDDLVLARFDVACSLAHVEALEGGTIVTSAQAAVLRAALHAVEEEIAGGTFAYYARSLGAEDVHGAIDARVRELAGGAGEWLHAGRSRNDQVATTLLLYVRERARSAAHLTHSIARALVARASEELAAQTVVAACTHRQPAQPVLLAFALAAWSEPFVRALKAFLDVECSAAMSCPLGSAALAGSGLPLDRERAARTLGFSAPSRNALDAIGNRDAALDLAHACVRAVVDASRIAEEVIAWATPAYGYVRLGDAASTGSSLMPQKRNPDPFELVRAHAARLVGAYAGALATLCGLAPSYQRDLQVTKSLAIGIVEDALRALDAFARAWEAVTFVRERMEGAALEGYTIATDVADAMIAGGTSPREAHARVGAQVARAESEGRALDASLDARASIAAKRTHGSTAPADVREQVTSLESELAALAEEMA